MKILQIIASLCIGGAEKIARDIGLLAEPSGFETHYIVFGDEIGDYEQELKEHGCTVYHWPSPSRSYLRFFSSLKQLIHNNQYDVVHAHTMFNIGWAMLAAKQCGVPVRVAHAHSVLDVTRTVKRHIYEKTMRQVILQNATDLVACGDAAGIRLYGEKAYCKRGQCILNGIDTEQFEYSVEHRARIRKALNLDDTFVIGHVGHLIEVKNQSFLIQLMPEILERKPNAKLLMLGDGMDRQKLEKLIHSVNLENQVIITGNVQNVSDYLSAMDVFAFPSFYEGMPLSIIEVQANGLPCILSTGVPKDVYLTDLVTSLPLDQPQQWIQCICGAKRINAGTYANDLKTKGFDISSVMEKFLIIYERDEKY